MLRELPPPIDIHYASGVVKVSAGANSQRLRITAQAMLQNLLPRVSDRCLDLLEIAAGAYTLDRIYKRARTKANDAGIRVFRPCFHVSDLDYWRQPSVCDLLADLLNFLTGDLWLVSFDRSQRIARTPQSVFDLGLGQRSSHIALYSGGLDSAAGLACELLQGQRGFLLLTASHQASIRRRSMEQLQALKGLIADTTSLTHLSFVVHLENPGLLRAQEVTQRSRGFLFCAAAAVLAASSGIQAVHVYENGHGAVNLPATLGALSGGFATRGAHPSFLRMVSDLASDALASKVQFKLPFRGMTKAEMVAKLANRQGLAEWAQSSRSCVHTSWRERGVAHCGQCPACIERHQAFLAAGVEDCTRYGSGRIWERSDPLGDDYFRAYLDDAIAWSERDPRVMQRFRQHCALSGINEIDRVSLAQLHQKQAKEVLSTYGHLSAAPDRQVTV